MVHTDELIKKEVVEQLIRDERVNASGIAVEVSGGTVILRGEVPTHFEKSSAFEDAQGAIGVSDVINELRVGNPSGIPAPADR